MPRLWAISSSNSNIQRLQVEFNKYGKPIGPNKSNYVEFLGSIVRNGNLAPLDFKDWHKVPATFKKDMLDKVKVIILKFDIYLYCYFVITISYVVKHDFVGVLCCSSWI